jgi:nitroimidazol reductase NimA-like FMN-containing flavoprotein (pyridoxamine 5'-phosphate oxidase superfamily)
MVRRRAGRAQYNKATVHSILDEGFVGHAGISSDGQPYVIPMLYARVGEQLYLHGSPLSRLVDTLMTGVSMSFAVTLIDGVVLARSAFHHSVNYRSVVILGEAHGVRERGEKLAALEAIVEHVAAGRSQQVRGPSDHELAATEVVALPLKEVSAKIRSGPPVDAADDYPLPVWAGELPLRLAPGVPLPDPDCVVPIPDNISRWRRLSA